MTRAWVLLGHGRWGEAVALNPVTPLALGVAALWFVLLLRARQGNPLPTWFTKAVAPALVLAIGVYGVARIALVASGHMTWNG